MLKKGERWWKRKRGRLRLRSVDEAQEQIQNYLEIHFCTQNSPLAKGTDEKNYDMEKSEEYAGANGCFYGRNLVTDKKVRKKIIFILFFQFFFSCEGGLSYVKNPYTVRKSRGGR